MTARRITATYRIETAYPIREAVETMAGEQSTGTFVRLPGETDEMRELYGAHIESVTELGEVAEPSLPGAGVPKGLSGKPVWRRAEVVLSWPLANFGASLPNLVATVAGNLFELRPFSGLAAARHLAAGGVRREVSGAEVRGRRGRGGCPGWRGGR